MKSDLRNLVTAEEAFFSDSSKYTATITDLKFEPRQASSPAIVTGAGDWTRRRTRSCRRAALRYRHQHDEPDDHERC